ncbi:hypothetical protein GN956_G204, partial [Arapaima gigas]
SSNPQCPKCPGILRASLNSAGCPLQYTQCSQLPESHLFCRFCLAPWKPIHENGMERCSNQSCEVVFTLLTCETVTNPSSKVLDCPIFRACAMCHSLIMHVDGCKYVSCQQCQYKFCFICLEDTKVCKQDKELYWALSCKKPRAKRQTFVT